MISPDDNGLGKTFKNGHTKNPTAEIILNDNRF